MNSYTRLGTLGILALVALRIGIGWHFYMEGATKVRSNDFSSVGFLNAAKGPLAEKFREMIWDHDGKLRLDEKRVKEFFTAATNGASKHFSFTDGQREELKKISMAYEDKLSEVYDGANEDILKYNRSRARLLAMNRTHPVASLQGQKEKVENEMLGAVKPTMAAVEAIWNQYEKRLNSLATAAQRKAVGPYRFSKPGEGMLTTAMVDKIIPIFDMTVGILLIIGLLTPLASIVGAAFLLSIVLTQMPGYPGTTPTYNQAIECLALLLLAATDAGRYAGLDFIPWAWWHRGKANLPLEIPVQTT
jgi:uncharacterized membrane protein YphA (DoxX/SURF4 family)